MYIRFFKRIRVFLLPLTAAALLTGCGARGKKAPNVVLITIDTLRADHCSINGYERETTPFLDSIAAKGSYFENTYPSSSWTAPSMASVCCGLYARQHGVNHGTVVGRAGKASVQGQEVLSDRFVTLAEPFRKAGYKTFGIAVNAHLAPEFGFAQGFDKYQMLWFGDCPIPNEHAEAWKEEILAADKYLLWIHYFDPHPILFAREPWVSRYNTNAAEIARWSGIDGLPSKRNELKKNPAGLKPLMDIYDSEINFCDDHVRMLFESFGVGDEDIVVITADHGEEFLEHDWLGHGYNLYNETVHVPLIIKLPAGEDVIPRVKTPVNNKDSLATMLDAAGLLKDSGVAGASLIPLMKGEEMDYGPVYIEVERYDAHVWRGMREGDWKVLIHQGEKDSWELYNLADDPGEKHNLAESEPQVFASMQKRLLDWLRANPPFDAAFAQQELTEEQEEKLRSVGYLR